MPLQWQSLLFVVLFLLLRVAVIADIHNNGDRETSKWALPINAMPQKTGIRYHPKHPASQVSNLVRLPIATNSQINKWAPKKLKPAVFQKKESSFRNERILEFNNNYNILTSNFQSSVGGFDNNTLPSGIPHTRIISSKLVINVLVSKEGVKIFVNGNLTYSSWNKFIKWGTDLARLHAGVHVVTLHGTTGRLMRAVNLMTWQMASAAELVKEIRSVNSGRLLVLVGAPDFLKWLSSEAIASIGSIGSNLISRLAQYESFVLISRSGGGSVAKNISGDIGVAARGLYEAVRTKTMLAVPEEGNSNNDGPPMHVEAVVERVETARCPDSSGQSAAHRLFCERYEGYGAFCACDATLQQYLEQQEQNMTLPTIAVALIGCRRTPQVLQQLGVIRRHPGGRSVPTVMCLDGHNDEAEDLARLLNVSVIVNENNPFKKGSSTRVNHMIQWSLSQVFAVFPDAEFAIILEDDLQLSPDFMPFFRQTTSLLADPKELLFCVNAYNYLAYPETASNYSRLIRHQGPPGFGWMITRAVAKELEEYDLWPLEQNLSDWDFYLKTTLLDTRHILAPEVPRTRHVGGGGVHVTGLEQERYFNKRVFNEVVDYVKLDVDSARRAHYYKALRDGIHSAVVLDLNSTHPCHPNLLEGHPENTSFVMYLDMPTEADEYKAFVTVMKCFGGNDRSTHEQLLNMYLIHRSGHTLYIVACPRSYYCKHSPVGRPIYRPSADAKFRADQTYLQRDPITRRRSIRMPAEHDPWEEFIMANTYDLVRVMG